MLLLLLRRIGSWIGTRISIVSAVVFLSYVGVTVSPALGACELVDNTFHRSVIDTDTCYDAAGAEWAIFSEPDALNYTIHIDGTAHLDWRGGLVRFTNPEDTTRIDRYFQDGIKIGGAAFKLNGTSGGELLAGARTYNAFDGVKVGPDFTVSGSWFSYTRDDCVENDGMLGGVIEDSLFDGCYVFLSARNSDTTVLPKGPVTVRDSLIFLQAMPGPDDTDDPAIVGHGPLFKFGPNSPPLNLENNIFLFTGEGLDWRADAFLGFPVALNSCSGNVIVWLGDGDFPGDVPFDPACVTVTKDRSVWDQARDAWLAAHPEVMRIDGLDAPAPEPAPDPIAVQDPTLDGSTSLDPVTDPVLSPDVIVETAPDTGSGSDSTATTADTDAPTVTIISPTEGSTMFSGTTLWVEVEAQDNVDVDELLVYVGSKKEDPFVFQGGGTAAFAWGIPPGFRYNPLGVIAVAYDRAGNKTEASVLVRIANSRGLSRR